MNDVLSPLGMPAAPARRWHRYLWAALVVALVCGVLAATVVLYRPRHTVVEVMHQPRQIAYADGRTHVAVLWHARAPIAALRLSEDTTSDLDHYVVVLGSDPSGTYGHAVRLDATSMDPVDLTVEWTADGAWLAYGSGHRVFVPADAFTGGR